MECDAKKNTLKIQTTMKYDNISRSKNSYIVLRIKDEFARKIMRKEQRSRHKKLKEGIRMTFKVESR
jgi:hypothetical protein